MVEGEAGIFSWRVSIGTGDMHSFWFLLLTYAYSTQIPKCYLLLRRRWSWWTRGLSNYTLSWKFYPLIPRKVQESACQRMCYSREFYKPESGMIHLEDFSWREQQIQGPLWDEFQRTHILSPLSWHGQYLASHGRGLEGVTLTWIGSASPATSEITKRTDLSESPLGDDCGIPLQFWNILGKESATTEV